MTALTAPHGLALVQGLANTTSTGSGRPDLLLDPIDAQAWLDATLAPWSERTNLAPTPLPPLVIRTTDLPVLRELRQRVRAYLSGSRDASGIRQPLVIRAGKDGGLRLQPEGAGLAWLASVVWGEVFLAQQSDSLRRLKLCRNEACGSAFYDRSKPNTGVWHDVKTCGNAANQHASRARKRAGAT